MRYLKTKRIVVKIGTNTLSKQDGSIDYKLIFDIAEQISYLKKQGKEFIIVTSGAIGLGCKELSLSHRPEDIMLRQVCAAIGQSKVMGAYHQAFSHYNGAVAQILLTYDDFLNENKHRNLRNVIDKLLRLNVTPVINENDVVATDEIGDTFGDNDKLSAMVSVDVGASLLIILTDVNGFYNKDPRGNDNARLIKEIKKITPEIEDIANSSNKGVGGMKTKIKAVKICMEAGCNVVITNGKEKEVVRRIVSGEEIGTLFLA